VSTIDIRVPEDLWEDAQLEGVVLVWIYSDGALVKENDVLMELTVEKAQLEIKAPAAGRLNILAQPETVIRMGDVVGTITTG
jgi:pyruvate/2-oxoglutarate dehydrogenase complex dihydrolipoamide acyltransferase (E2) component